MQLTKNRPHLFEITVLIVDDEIGACENLISLIENLELPNIVVIGFANTLDEAEHIINSRLPHVILLDIEMNSENSIHFLERILPKTLNVIFTTAYDHYAVKAFKMNAIDYLLKPIDIEALEHALKKSQKRYLSDRLEALPDLRYDKLAKSILSNAEQDYIVFSDSYSREVVPMNDLLYLEAMGSYSKAFFIRQDELHSIVVSQSVADYEEALSGSFIRCHKSYIINIDRVEKITADNTYLIHLPYKVIIPIARRRYSTLLSIFKKT